MAIRLDVEKYCHGCADFSAEVTKSQRVQIGDGEYACGDTIVQCEYRKRCNAIRRFLEHQIRGENDGKHEANV
jgi:hypothetical protein